jgi:hypothetical protein
VGAAYKSSPRQRVLAATTENDVRLTALAAPVTGTLKALSVFRSGPAPALEDVVDHYVRGLGGQSQARTHSAGGRPRKKLAMTWAKKRSRSTPSRRARCSIRSRSTSRR